MEWPAAGRVTAAYRNTFRKFDRQDWARSRLLREPLDAAGNRGLHPMTYRDLADSMKRRYEDFLENKAFHKIRQALEKDKKFVIVRLLHPANPRSSGGIVQSPFRKDAAMIYRPTHLRLVVVALILLGIVGDSPTRLLGEEPPRTALLVAGRFKIDIAGMDLSSADTVTVEVDPVEIEMHDVTESNDPTWKQFAPGAVRYGGARFTFRVSDSKFNKDLEDWQKNTGAGNEARKTISVWILDKKGRIARRYTLLDCFPVRFAPAGGMYLVNRVCPHCPQSDNLAELTVQIGSIEIDGGSQADQRERDPGSGTGSVTNSDQIVRYKGFDVEIRNLGETSGDIDSSWGEVRGGAVGTEMVEATPRKQYVSDITMTGHMTSTRKELMEWLNASAKGEASKLRADVTITPKTVDGTAAPMHQYGDCMITRIEIPRLTAGSAEPIEEKVTFRPTRRTDPN